MLGGDDSIRTREMHRMAGSGNRNRAGEAHASKIELLNAPTAR
jgi:hypothetical protein